jgi:hypothetical protein
MRNPDKEFKLGDLSGIEDINPYDTPRSANFNQRIDVKQLKVHRNLLMILFSMSILVSLVPFVFATQGIALEYTTTMYIVGSLVSFFLGIGTIVFVYVVNTYMGSNGKAFFIAVITLVPLLGLYIVIRTIILSKKLLKEEYAFK